MAKKKVTRKQLLKEPDEFITTTGKLIEWSRQNTKPLTIGAALFLVVIIGLSAYLYFTEKRSMRAQVLFSHAVTKHQAQENQTSSTAALSAVSADFDTLTTTYGSLPAGKLGRIYYGHISSAALDYDKAIEQYQKALGDYGDEPVLSNIILNGLATAYHQKGKYPEAIAYYKRIADGSASTLKDAALFNLGKLHGQLGQSEESRKAYERLSTEFPNSFYVNMVNEKIAG